jgi:hypothetical protein
MPKITYHSLFELVDSQINRKLTYNTKTGYTAQGERVSVAPFSGDSISDRTSSKVLLDLIDIVADSIPSHIKEGLLVTATDPITSSVNISAGSGAAAGFVYTLDADVTLPIPFDSTTSVFYINIYKDAISIDKTQNSRKLTIAKIIVPEPGITDRVIDKRDSSWDAYIQNFTEYKLYGDGNGILEEDTIDILREAIGAILADNLIGNIRLSEDLKIINSSGSLSIDSSSLKIYDNDGTILSKFNENGIFIYNDSGNEIAKFTGTEARIGNIRVLINALQSGNFVEGSTGFRLKDNGDVEFNDLTVRGTVYATAGSIGGWEIADDKIFANPTGAIQTGQNVGIGQNGVILDFAGLRVYDAVLGLVVNLPSDGSAPTFSSGVITSVTWEINTNSVLRTSETVGDGSALSYGLLMNNTGLYGCGPNQYLSDSNLKVLANGDVFLKGEIVATSGSIGGVTISNNRLVGGTIEGALLIGATIVTDDVLPRISIDSTGIGYEITGAVGQYGSFLYGDGTLYGTGLLAKLFDENYPVLAILSEQNLADIRLYNRTNAPVAGSHAFGDLICIDGDIYKCHTEGSPGTFKKLLTTNIGNVVYLNE